MPDRRLLYVVGVLLAISGCFPLRPGEVRDDSHFVSAGFFDGTSDILFTYTRDVYQQDPWANTMLASGEIHYRT